MSASLPCASESTTDLHIQIGTVSPGTEATLAPSRCISQWRDPLRLSREQTSCRAHRPRPSRSRAGTDHVLSRFISLDARLSLTSQSVAFLTSRWRPGCDAPGGIPLIDVSRNRARACPGPPWMGLLDRLPSGGALCDLPRVGGKSCSGPGNDTPRTLLPIGPRARALLSRSRAGAALGAAVSVAEQFPVGFVPYHVSGALADRTFQLPIGPSSGVSGNALLVSRCGTDSLVASSLAVSRAGVIKALGSIAIAFWVRYVKLKKRREQANDAPRGDVHWDRNMYSLRTLWHERIVSCRHLAVAFSALLIALQSGLAAGAVHHHVDPRGSHPGRRVVGHPKVLSVDLGRPIPEEVVCSVSVSARSGAHRAEPARIRFLNKPDRNVAEVWHDHWFADG